MDFLEFAKKKVVIFDGAMGTNLVARRSSFVNRNASRFTLHASRLICSEAYNLYAPEIVEEVHRSFVDAGCDVIETNTFNANGISLAEFGLEKEIVKITEKAVSVARNIADSVDRKVFVSGNVGPTSKLPSLGQISFDRLLEAYTEEIEVLVKSGVDIIQMDTCQDLLQAKIAVIACNDIFEKTGKKLPIIVNVTIDQSGRLLLGTELDAVLATLVPLGVSVVGLNCGLGPKGMESSVRYLSRHLPLPIAVLPNAGLPEIVDGETQYNLGPEEFADQIAGFVSELGVEMVGGCCGTTPEHISALVKKVIPVKTVIPAKAGIHLESKDPRLRGDDICNLCRDDVPLQDDVCGWDDSLSSLFSSTVIRQEPAPLLIGERMNVNGSKKFKEKILAEDFDGAAQAATDQEREGSHALDISMSYAGRDEAADFCKILEKVVGRTRLPISVDSTNPAAIEAALKKIPGRPIINSINLEDGGLKARKILGLAKRFGAAVVALTIDENGMAKDEGEKVEIAERLIALCAEYGIPPSSVLIDPLTFTLADPKAASYGSGARTLIAIKEIQKRLPDAGISLGVSNISFGFKRSARKVLNSVFLHEAVKAGLTAAIVHAGQIVPLASLDKKMVDVSLDLIWNRKKNALERFVEFFEGKKLSLGEVSEDLSADRGAELSIVRGDKVRLVEFLGKLLKDTKPKKILNDILLPAMAKVGKMFDKGELPLPFVLQSAEAMKTATDFLEPHLKGEDAGSRGKIVLATVRGDIHDIGKNLVDIILSNNGFEVINLGVKQPVENIAKSAAESGADIIGLSGLLVESALIMKDDLATLSSKGVSIPVICGGAALTKSYVEKELRSAYSGEVYYAKDAFAGLKIAQSITSPLPKH